MEITDSSSIVTHDSHHMSSVDGHFLHGAYRGPLGEVVVAALLPHGVVVLPKQHRLTR